MNQNMEAVRAGCVCVLCVCVVWCVREREREMSRGSEINWVVCVYGEVEQKDVFVKRERREGERLSRKGRGECNLCFLPPTFFRCLKSRQREKYSGMDHSYIQIIPHNWENCSLYADVWVLLNFHLSFHNFSRNLSTDWKESGKSLLTTFWYPFYSSVIIFFVCLWGNAQID